MMGEREFGILERSILSGDFFYLAGEYPEGISRKTESDILLADIMLVTFYGHNPILTHEELQQYVKKHDKPSTEFSREIKLKILFLFSYGYTHQENDPSALASQYISDINQFKEAFDELSKIDKEWFCLFLIQNLWLNKFSSLLDRKAYFEESLQALNSVNSPFLKSQLYIVLGYCHLVNRELDLMADALTQGREQFHQDLNPWSQLHFMTLQAFFLHYSHKYDQSFQLTKSILQHCDNFRYTGYNLFLPLFVLNAGKKKLRFDEITHFLEKQIEDYHLYEVVYRELALLGTISQIYYNIKHFTRYFTIINRELHLCYLNEFHEHHIRRLYQLGMYFLNIKHDYPQAFYYFTKILWIARGVAHPDSFLVGYGYRGLAQYFDLLGEFTKALDYYNKTLRLPDNFAQSTERAIAHSGIARNWTNQGNYVKAFEELEKVNELFYRIRHIQHGNWVESLLDTSVVLGKMDRYRESLEYLRKVLELEREQSGDIPDMIGIRARYQQLKISLQSQRVPPEEIEQLYERTRRYFQRRTQIGPVIHYLRLIEAMRLSYSPRLENKFKALDIYRDLADIKLPYTVKLDIYLPILEILGMEYKMSGYEEVKIELMEYLDKFYAMGIGETNYFVTVHYLILNSKIELIDYEFKAANILLDLAATVCTKSNLDHLLEVVHLEQGSLADLLTIWDNNLQNNQEILEKIRESDIESYLKKLLSNE